MIVYKTDLGSHWIYCEKTKKVININAQGARKVASVCSIDVTEISTSEMNKLRARKLNYLLKKD